VHPGLKHSQPQRQAHRDVRRGAPDLEPAQGDQGGDEQGGGQQRGQRQVVGVEDRDHQDGADVVEDRNGEQEQPQLIWATRAEQRKRAEHERDVGRHRDPPAPRAVPAGIDQEEDDRGQDHSTERG
jgi:hypothetical protein